MENSNLDINLIIQSFQEKVTQLTIELVVKDATIKQLSEQIKELKKPNWQSPSVAQQPQDNTEYDNIEQQQKPRKGMI